MTNDGRMATIRIWGVCAFFVAVFVAAATSTIAEVIWPALVTDVVSEPRSRGWIVFGSALMVAILGYLFLHYIWRPYWILDRMALDRGAKSRLLVALAARALWPGFVIGILLTPIGFDSESGWMFLAFLPAFYAIQWFEKRANLIVDGAIEMAGIPA